MGRGIRQTRYLSEIRSVRELREAKRELELRDFFARERLAEDVAETFSVGNLLSLVAPPGSVVNRMMGGMETGLSAVQAVLGVVGSLLDGRRSRNKPAARTPRRNNKKKRDL